MLGLWYLFTFEAVSTSFPMAEKNMFEIKLKRKKVYDLFLLFQKGSVRGGLALLLWGLW